MKIIHLEAQNFMALGNVELNSIDKMGLVLLQGKNLDDPSASSNGAGKSSLVDAISWCLWGETARGESGDNVVNDVAGKDCKVQLTLEDDGDHYRITRYRKHYSGKNNLMVFQISGGHPKNLTQGTTDLTQAIVERVMGCKADVFNAAIYAGQEKMPDLPSMTDKALKVIVEQAAGIDRLQAAHEVARQRRATAAGEFEMARINVDQLARQVLEDQQQLAEQERQRDDWDVKQKGVIDAAENAVTVARANVATAEKDAAASQKAIDSAREKIAEIRKRIDGAAGEKVQQQRLRNELTTIDREFQRTKAQAQNYLTAVNKAKSDKAHIHNRIGVPCAQCERPLEAKDLAGAERAADNLVTEHTKQAQVAALSARDIQTKLTAAQKALVDFELTMTDVSAEVVAERTLNAGIATEQRYVDAVAVEKTKLSHAESTLVSAKAVGNPYIVTVSNTGVRLLQRKQAHDKAKFKLAQAEKALDLAEKAVKVFGPLGVRGLILDTVTPFLNDRTAHYLGVLSDGNINAVWTTLSKTAKGEVREKFAIEVTNTKGGKKFGLLSGGEKRKVRLASAMALQDLVAARATKPLNIFIADEIDHALDAAGLERLMGILEEKAKEKGSVIVVSHSNLRDWIRNVICVIKEGGVSRVEVETS